MILKKAVVLTGLILGYFLFFQRTYANPCNPAGGQTCYTNPSTGCYTVCCTDGPYANPCTSWTHTCYNSCETGITCSVPEDCPNKSNVEQCGSGLSTCTVQKTCVSGQCQYNCIGQCGSTPGATPTPGNPGSCDANAWTPWTTNCVGSPATQERINQCGTVQYRNCTGNILARGKVVSRSDTSCSAVASSTTGVPGTVFQFAAGSASQPLAQTQSDNIYVTFANIVGGTYILASQAPANYNLAAACWSKLLNPPLTGTGLTTNLSEPTNADALAWDLGYTLGSPWVQTQGGNVYAAGNVTSYIPSGITPRVFSLNGGGGYPGVVTYGTNYDFDASPTSQGPTLVSSTNWLTNQTHAVLDYYQIFYHKLGSPTTFDYNSPPNVITQPAGRATPYYVNGDMTTSGNWSVGSGQTIIFLVNGNLTIGGNINITGTGFVAFIVSGNITVSSSVGVPYTSNSPVVEGVYIASPSGTFATGTSSIVGSARFVGRGMFIAGNFLLQRDLDAISQNQTTSAELFSYNPQLLVTMPDSMKDVPITWQEVAP